AGIGIERALTIEAGRLEAVSNLEGINILDQSGDLTIGGVTPNLSKPALPGLYVNNGDINVRTVGSLTVDESLVNTGSGNIVMTAANSIAQNANIHALGGNVAMTATSGDIAMADGTLTSANGNIVYQAGTNLQVAEMVAGGDIDLTATQGAITAQADVARNLTSTNLLVRAANGIGDLASALKTGVAKITAALTGSGAIHINEADAVELAQVSNANGDINVTAGGSITADQVVASQGRVTMESTGSVTSTTQGRMVADDLVIRAVDGIAVNTQANSADLRVLGAGNLSVVETDSLRLTNLTTADGDVTVNAGGQIGVDTLVAGGIDRNVSLTAGNSIVQSRAAGTPGNAIVGGRVALTAGTGIGNGENGALTLDA